MARPKKPSLVADPLEAAKKGGEDNASKSSASAKPKAEKQKKVKTEKEEKPKVEKAAPASKKSPKSSKPKKPALPRRLKATKDFRLGRSKQKKGRELFFGHYTPAYWEALCAHEYTEAIK